MKLNHTLEESSSWSSLLDALKLVRSIEVHTGSRIRDAVILFLCVIATASGGCASAPSTSQVAGQEILVLAEYGILSFVSPNGGTLQDVPLKHHVGSPYGLNSRPTLMVSTRNEEGITVLQELTQDGTVLKEYPFPRELEFIYAFSVSPKGERVLFYYKHKQVHGIRVDSLNGGESRVVFEPIDTIELKDLQWSPDEKLFAFTRQARPPLGLKQWVFEVNVVDLANSHHVAASTSPITNTMLPAFLPMVVISHILSACGKSQRVNGCFTCTNYHNCINLALAAKLPALSLDSGVPWISFSGPQMVTGYPGWNTMMSRSPVSIESDSMARIFKKLLYTVLGGDGFGDRYGRWNRHIGVVSLITGGSLPVQVK